MRSRDAAALHGVADEGRAVVEEQRDVARAVTGRVDDASGKTVLVEPRSVVERDDRADSAQPEAGQRRAGEELVELGVGVEPRRDQDATGRDRPGVLGVRDDLEPGHLVENLRKAAEVVGVPVRDDRELEFAGVAPDVADPAENRAAVTHHAGVDQVEPLVGLDEVAVGGDALDAVDSHVPLGATPVPTGAAIGSDHGAGWYRYLRTAPSRSKSARLRSIPQR